MYRHTHVYIYEYEKTRDLVLLILSETPHNLLFFWRIRSVGVVQIWLNGLMRLIKSIEFPSDLFIKKKNSIYSETVYAILNVGKIDSPHCDVCLPEICINVVRIFCLGNSLNFYQQKKLKRVFLMQ